MDQIEGKLMGPATSSESHTGTGQPIDYCMGEEINRLYPPKPKTLDERVKDATDRIWSAVDLARKEGVGG